MAPKDMNFTTTKSLEHRVALVVGVDSIGYLSYTTDVSTKLGFELNETSVEFLKKRDIRREYFSKHNLKKKRGSYGENLPI